MTTNTNGYSENSPFNMNFPDKNKSVTPNSNPPHIEGVTTNNVPVVPTQITPPVTNEGYSTNSPFTGNIPQSPQNQQQTLTNPQPISQPLNNPNIVTGNDGTVFTWKNNPDLSPRNTGNQNSIANNNIPVNYNVGLGREQDIINNIADGIKNDTRVKQAVESGDFETFKKIYGYDTADDTKKNILTNQFQASFLMDENSLFSGLIAGRKYANEVITKPEYKNAQDRANKYLKYGSASVNELTAYMNSGELLQGTQAYDDLLRNPTIAEKLRQAKTFALSRGNLNLETIGEKTKKEIVEKSPNTLKMLEDGYISAEEYEREIMTPSLRAKMEEVQEKKNKYDKLKREWDNIEEDVNKDSRYSGLSATGKRALIEDRRKGMRFTLGIAMDEFNNATGMLTEMQKQNSARFEANMSLAREQMEVERKKAMVEWEFQQKMKQQEMLNNDPFTAISSMVEKYEKMGVPMQRSTHEMVQDFKNSGKTLPEYLTELNKTIQGKDEYKLIRNAHMQALLPKTEDVKYGFEKLDNGVMAITNPKTGEVRYVNQNGAMIGGGGVMGDLRHLASQFPGQAWAKNNNPAGITWNAGFDNPQPGTTAYRLLEAGVKFSKGTARPANEGGNYVSFATIEDGLKAQRIMMTQTYGNATIDTLLQKWVGTAEGPNYAKQVAGMAGIADLNQKVSDLTDEQITQLQMAKIKKESPGLYKLLTQQQGGTQTKPLSDDAKTLIESIRSGRKTYAQVYDEMNKDGAGRKLLLEVEAGINEDKSILNKERQRTIEKYQETLSEVNYLLGNADNWWDVDLGDISGEAQFVGPLSGNARDNMVRKLQILASQEWIKTLQDAKQGGATFGALSDTENKMLMASGRIASGFKDYDRTGRTSFTEKSLVDELEAYKNNLTTAINEQRMLMAGLSYDDNNLSNNVSNMSIDEQTDEIYKAFNNR